VQNKAISEKVEEDPAKYNLIKGVQAQRTARAKALRFGVEPK
jgi:hypothetical protein